MMCAMREYTGRGPTKAKTAVNTDVVTVLLQESTTKAWLKTGRATSCCS